MKDYFISLEHFLSVTIIVQNASDNRWKENSEFTKCVRLIKWLNLISPTKPNVILVLTHATNIRPTKIPAEWHRNANMLKGEYERELHHLLGIIVPICFIENNIKAKAS